MPWEFELIRSIQETIGTNDIIANIMRIFTYMGDAGLIWLALSVPFLVKKNTRMIGLSVLVCWGVAVFQNQYLIKLIVQRDRPFVTDENINIFANSWLNPEGTFPGDIFCVPKMTSHSYFSSHSTMSFACATPFFFFNKKGGWIAYVVAALIGFSRIFFGVHFPTDVIGGMVLGIGIGTIVCFLMTYILNKIKIHNEPKSDSETLIY